MAFGSAVQPQQDVGSIKALIKQHYGESRDVGPLKVDTWVRSSGLPMLCPLEEVLRARHEVVRKDTVDAALMLTFLHGKSLHWGVQNELLAGLGVLVGVWKCLACSRSVGQDEYDARQFDRLPARPKVCGSPECPSNASDYAEEREFLYMEQLLRHEKFLITGHADGFLRMPGLPGLGILEVKSVSQKSAWEIRSVPKMDHVVQAHLYMWMTGLKWAKLFYWDKSGYGITALTEHTIHYEETLIDKVKEGLVAMRAGLAGGPLPDRICQADDCPRAQKCCVVKQCFAPEEKPF